MSKKIMQWIERYQNIEYKNSQAYHSVMSATEDQLIICKSYYEIAVKSHKQNGNKGQVKFFSDGLDLVNRRIKDVSRSSRLGRADNRL